MAVSKFLEHVSVSPLLRADCLMFLLLETLTASAGLLFQSLACNIVGNFFRCNFIRNDIFSLLCFLVVVIHSTWSSVTCYSVARRRNQGATRV